MRRLVVIPDEASATAVATALTGGEDDDEIDEDKADVPTIRGDAEPADDEPVPLEPMPDVRPDDDGWSCCQGGMLSLFLSRRLASSNEMRFLLDINCFAKNRTKGNSSKGAHWRQLTLFNSSFATFQGTQG